MTDYSSATSLHTTEKQPLGTMLLLQGWMITSQYWSTSTSRLNTTLRVQQYTHTRVNTLPRFIWFSFYTQ